MHWEYSQAVDDEQGMRLIGHTFNDPEIARVGIGDTPGAYLVTRQVTDWQREWVKPHGCVCGGPSDPYHSWCEPCMRARL